MEIALNIHEAVLIILKNKHGAILNICLLFTDGFHLHCQQQEVLNMKRNQGVLMLQGEAG